VFPPIKNGVEDEVGVKDGADSGFEINVVVGFVDGKDDG